MLEVGKTYVDNMNKIVKITGRITDYSEKKPFVASVGGDWYDENTGCFITYSASNGHHALPIENIKSIKNHNPKE